MKPNSIHTTIALMCTMRLIEKSSTPYRKSGIRYCSPASRPNAIWAPNRIAATEKYFTASLWPPFRLALSIVPSAVMSALLVERFEVVREAIGVDAGHPFQERHDGARLFVGHPQFGHAPAEAVMHLVGRILDELDQEFLAHLSRTPERVQPRLGQIGRVIRAIPQERMAGHAVLRLHGQLAFAHQRLRFLLGELPAEQRF